jgi:hypothetical protein
MNFQALMHKMMVSSSGIVAAAAAYMEAYGTNPIAALVAVFGAAVAMVEAYERRWATRIAVSIFNATVGIIGGPVVSAVIFHMMEIKHPGILILASLLLGYAAHDVLDLLRIKKLVVERLTAWIRGGSK